MFLIFLRETGPHTEASSNFPFVELQCVLYNGEADFQHCSFQVPALFSSDAQHSRAFFLILQVGTIGVFLSIVSPSSLPCFRFRLAPVFLFYGGKYFWYAVERFRGTGEAGPIGVFFVCNISGVNRNQFTPKFVIAHYRMRNWALTQAPGDVITNKPV